MTALPRCINRLFEWTMGAALLAIGIHIMILPTAVASSRMAPILDLIVWPRLLGLFFVISSLVRLVGLYFIDRLGVWSNRMRAIGSTIGGLTWLQLAVALAIFSIETRINTSPMVCLYVALSAAEFLSTYRAQADGNSWH